MSAKVKKSNGKKNLNPQGENFHKKSVSQG